MNTYSDKARDNKSQSAAKEVSKNQNRDENNIPFVDNRPEAIAQRKIQEMVNNSPRVMQLKAFQEKVKTRTQAKKAAQLKSMGDNYTQRQMQGGLKATTQFKGASSFPLGVNLWGLTGPIQRLSTDSAPQPLADQSGAVPDLTNALVTQITNANTAGLRRTVLNDLLNYLNGLGIVDNLALTQVRYSHTPNANFAVTAATGTGDHDPIRITFYRDCFNAGPAVVYSTFRHELIHVGQRLQVPDEDSADPVDQFMHENIYDADVGVPTRLTVQQSLQEIETHCWELEHATETGINAAHIADTVTDLAQYANNLIAEIPGLPISTFIYWRRYITKSLGQLRDAFLVGHQAILNTRANALNVAIQARGNDRTRYNLGMARAQADGLAQHPGDVPYMEGFNQSRAGFARAQAGGDSQHSGQHAYFATFNQYNDGRDAAIVAPAAALPGGHTETWNHGYNDFQGGYQAALAAPGTALPGGHHPAWNTAFNDYQGGYQAALAAPATALPGGNTATWNTGYNDYRDGFLAAVAAPDAALPGGHPAAWNAAYNEYRDGYLAAVAAPATALPGGHSASWNAGYNEYRNGYLAAVAAPATALPGGHPAAWNAAYIDYRNGYLAAVATPATALPGGHSASWNAGYNEYRDGYLAAVAAPATALPGGHPAAWNAAYNDYRNGYLAAVATPATALPGGHSASWNAGYNEYRNGYLAAVATPTIALPGGHPIAWNEGYNDYRNGYLAAGLPLAGGILPGGHNAAWNAGWTQGRQQILNAEHIGEGPRKRRKL